MSKPSAAEVRGRLRGLYLGWTACDETLRRIDELREREIKRNRHHNPGRLLRLEHIEAGVRIVLTRIAAEGVKATSESDMANDVSPFQLCLKRIETTLALVPGELASAIYKDAQATLDQFGR